MSQIVSEVLEANRKHAAGFERREKLAMPPARRFAILTCMDARLDPSKFAGLADGDAHVIRNAGGRASDDAIRSLVISYKLLGMREFFVIHHSDCGMQFFTNEVMRGLLASSLETAELTPNGFRDTGRGPCCERSVRQEWPRKFPQASYLRNAASWSAIALRLFGRLGFQGVYAIFVIPLRCASWLAHHSAINRTEQKAQRSPPPSE